MSKAQFDKDYLTTRQVAKTLGVCLRTIQLWCESGIMASRTTLGGHRRIAKDEVERVRFKCSQAAIVNPTVGGTAPASLTAFRFSFRITTIATMYATWCTIPVKSTSGLKRASFAQYAYAQLQMEKIIGAGAWPQDIKWLSEFIKIKDNADALESLLLVSDTVCPAAKLWLIPN